MKTQAEVEAMLSKFDGRDHEEFEGEPGEGIYDALLWVLDHRSEGNLLAHIEEV